MTGRSLSEKEKWVVTTLDAKDRLVVSIPFTDRVVDLWGGANRLWRMTPDGELRRLTEQETAWANEEARARG